MFDNEVHISTKEAAEALAVAYAMRSGKGKAVVVNATQHGAQGSERREMFWSGLVTGLMESNRGATTIVSLVGGERVFASLPIEEVLKLIKEDGNT